jgi:hypothetical protein
MDFMALGGFPQTAGHGIVVSVTGTRVSSMFTKIDGNGEFVAGNIVLQTFPEIVLPHYAIFYRHSFTFTIPYDVTQICLRIVHAPYQTGAAVPYDYKYFLCRPALGIGTAEQRYLTKSQAEDMVSMSDRYKRLFVNYSGAVTRGQVIVQNQKFMFPFWELPTCSYCKNEWPSSSFKGASPEDVSQITTIDCNIGRMADETSSTGQFRTYYSLSAPLW